MTTTIRLQREPFDITAEAERLAHGRTDIGAIVTFTGLCRADENGEPIAARPARDRSGHDRARGRNRDRGAEGIRVRP